MAPNRAFYVVRIKTSLRDSVLYAAYLTVIFSSVSAANETGASGGFQSETRLAASSENSVENSTTLSLFGRGSGAAVESLFSGQSVATLFSPSGGRSIAQFFEHLSEEQQRFVIDRAFPLKEAIWDSPNIFVCWEDFDDEFREQRAFVKGVIEDTWGAVSSLEFIGWEHCTEQQTGIRIAVQDEGPHVQKLGKFVSGMESGMVLNFTYSNWEPTCGKSQRNWQICTRMTAVHEFGHAIGFAHEQNRSDTPEDCSFKQRPQGTDGDDEQMTPWDAASVMNYCNPKKMNNGVLSKFDVQAVQQIYGST